MLVCYAFAVRPNCGFNCLINYTKMSTELTQDVRELDIQEFEDIEEKHLVGQTAMDGSC